MLGLHSSSSHIQNNCFSLEVISELEDPRDVLLANLQMKRTQFIARHIFTHFLFSRVHKLFHNLWIVMGKREDGSLLALPFIRHSLCLGDSSSGKRFFIRA